MLPSKRPAAAQKSKIVSSSKNKKINKERTLQVMKQHKNAIKFAQLKK